MAIIDAILSVLETWCSMRDASLMCDDIKRFLSHNLAHIKSVDRYDQIELEMVACPATRHGKAPVTRCRVVIGYSSHRGACVTSTEWRTPGDVLATFRVIDDGSTRWISRLMSDGSIRLNPEVIREHNRALRRANRREGLNP